MSLQAPIKEEFSEVTESIRALFSTPISVAATDPTVPRSAAYPEEAACLPPMRALRRREFLAGREALRCAIAGLGFRPQPIPVRDDRAPELPEGVVASLSHSAELCVAVADRSDNSAGIGLDIEPFARLDPALWDTVCTRTERAWLADQPDETRAHLAMRIFSAKEAAYKCQYAQTNRLLDFTTFDVTFGAGNLFYATFREPVGPFAVSDRICGRAVVVAGHIISAARIPA